MAQTELQIQAREKGFAAATSVVAAIFLTSLKLVVGLMTGSLGILAEAAHSALDLGAALITFFAVRVSDRPADEMHLYGHGKVENLSALAETVLLLVTCIWIIYEALNRLLFSSVEVDPSFWAFFIMGLSIVVDFSRSRVLARAAKKYNSQALEADALHFSTDIWSSSVVIVGLTLVWIGDLIGQKSILTRADAVAALGVAVIVIYVSLQLGRRTINALLDTAPAGLAEKIRAAVLAVDEVRRVLQLRVRGSGNQIFVDLHVAVPRHLSFEESHAVTHQVREEVHAVSPGADVTITTVPLSEDEGVLERIQTIAARGHFAVHNITTHLTPRGIWIDLDLEVPPDITFEEAHARATALETQLRAELAKSAKPAAASGGAGPLHPQRVADVNVHIEPRAEELIPGAEMPVEEKVRYLDRLKELCQRIPHARGCYDIDLQTLDRGTYLALHLLVDPELSVAEVHSIAEELENELRREFPHLGRVVIHAEPFTDRAAAAKPAQG